MALTQNLMGGSGESPEIKQMKSERNRVQSYIRAYARNPKNWSNNMIMQLEQMAAQYQVPFKRQIPEASAAWKAAGYLGGAADSVAFGFLPDSWYSDESNRKQANIGKIGGAGLQVAAGVLASPFTGGASLAASGKGALAAIQAAKGLSKVGAIAKGAIPLAAQGVSKTPLGRLTKSSIESGRKALQPYGNKKGWNWATGAQTKVDRAESANILAQARTAIEKGDDLGAVVKGKNLSKEHITSLTKKISRRYGGKKSSGAVEQEYLKQLATAKTTAPQLSSVTTDALMKLANKKFGNKLVNEANVKSALKSVGADASPDDIAAIVKKLQEANITRMSNSASEIMKLARKTGGSSAPTPASFADIGKMDLGIAGLGAVGAGSSLMDYTPSREALEQQEDPYDPYNR